MADFEHPLRQTFGGMISFLMRGLAEGSITMPVTTYLLYQRRNAVSQDLTEAEVDAMITGIERVNQQWPGTFVPVSPPKPRPADRNEVIWIMDSRVLWPVNRGHPPSSDDILRVALGEGTMAEPP